MEGDVQMYRVGEYRCLGTLVVGIQCAGYEPGIGAYHFFIRHVPPVVARCRQSEFYSIFLHVVIILFVPLLQTVSIQCSCPTGTLPLHLAGRGHWTGSGPGGSATGPLGPLGRRGRLGHLA